MSCDKNLVKTEGLESMASHSEKNYDDQQEEQKGSSNHEVQPPEVTMRDAASYEELNLKVKNLTEKLSAALVDVSAKDDLVKQHSKVAEEAVVGWEKAENEAAILKQQLEASLQKNLALEDRVGHIDGALKECVRQLRQSKEEREQKLHEAILEKNQELETDKLELETQLHELQTQVEASKSEPPATADLERLDKIDFLEQENGLLERENTALKLELFTRSEELEIMTIERDLSIQAAETASKQHLEGIKKFARLKADSRKLKAAARKPTSIHDQRSVNASSHYVESLTDSQSDNGDRFSAVENVNEFDPSCSDSWASALIVELDQFKSEKSDRNLVTSTMVEIDLMGDFLEMERLAALPTTETKNHYPESERTIDQFRSEEETPLELELEAMHHKTKVDEKLMTAEAQKELKDRLEDMKMKLNNMENEETPLKLELEAMHHHKTELEEKLMKMEAEKRELEEKLEDMKTKLNKRETEENPLKLELEAMHHHKTEIEEKLMKMEAKKGELEEKLEDMKMKSDNRETEKNSLKLELEAMHRIKTELEEKLMEMEAKKEKLEDELEDMKIKLDKMETEKDDLQIGWQDRLNEAEKKLLEVQTELQLSNERKRDFESQLITFEAEARTMSARIGLLEAEVEKERNLSKEMSLRCRKLEDDLSTKRLEVELEKAECSNGELKIKQEDLVKAASKLSECQETIASLGKQLKSLATLEDFLIDPTNLTEFSEGGSALATASGAIWRLHSNNTYLSQRNQDSLNLNLDNSAASQNQTSVENGQSGYVKMFSRSKGGTQLDDH